MALLERGALLAALDRSLADAAAGAGSMALLAGEAGIGKTTLVRAFCDRHHADARVLWGACDALRTPRPLYDIARLAGAGLAAAMTGGEVSRHERFTAFLDTLVSPLRPVVSVIEDVHWADEATLDLLVFVARRVAGTHAVVVVTHRDDEVGPDHPLRPVLGHLAGLGTLRRLPLARLSPAATAELAAPHRADAGWLYRVTGGNPFLGHGDARDGRPATRCRRPSATPWPPGWPGCPARPGRCWRRWPCCRTGPRPGWCGRSAASPAWPGRSRSAGRPGSWSPPDAPSGSGTSWPGSPSSRRSRRRGRRTCTPRCWPTWRFSPPSRHVSEALEPLRAQLRVWASN
jgi:hypothetical protein